MNVTVVIPTLRRPAAFERAVRSIFAQQCNASFSIVAVDNDPDGSALPICAQLATESPVPFRFVHEANPGVANARNAALRIADGDFIAFLDDDQEAPTSWLHNLMQAQRQTHAEAVWGPVLAKSSKRAGGARARYLETLYTRQSIEGTRLIARYYGAGNALVRRDLFVGPTPFDPRANETGGEDDLFFSRLQRQGARFAWANGAAVIEHVEGARMRRLHIIKRAFAYGQGPCETAAATGDTGAIAKHMGIGVAQMSAFGLAAIAAFATIRPNRYDTLACAVRGAGKVFWFLPQKFYGAASLRARDFANHRSSHATVRSASV